MGRRGRVQPQVFIAESGCAPDCWVPLSLAEREGRGGGPSGGLLGLQKDHFGTPQPQSHTFQHGLPFGVHCSEAQRGRVTCLRSHSKFGRGLLTPHPMLSPPLKSSCDSLGARTEAGPGERLRVQEWTLFFLAARPDTAGGKSQLLTSLCGLANGFLSLSLDFLSGKP